MDTNFIVRGANKAFYAEEYIEALNLYQQAAKLLGPQLFKINVKLCEKKIKQIENKRLNNLFFILSVNKSLFLENQCNKYTTILGSNQFNFSREKQKTIAFKLWACIKDNNQIEFLKYFNESRQEEGALDLFFDDLVSVSFVFKEAQLKRETELVLDVASRIKQNVQILKQLYWAAFKVFDVKTAKETLIRIKEIDFSGKSNAWLISAKNKLDSISIGFEETSSLLSLRGNRAYSPQSNKIAYLLHNSLPYSSGGYATRAHGVAIGLQKSGFEMICITRPGYPFDIPGDHIGKEIQSVTEVDGIKYHRVFEPLRNSMPVAKYLLAAADAIKEFLIKEKVAIVLAASNHITAIPAGIAARELGLPYLYEVRGFWEITRLSREPGFENSHMYMNQVRYETLAAIHADRVFTLTNPMKEELVSRGVSVDKITLLPNSCNPNRFEPRSRDLDLSHKLKIPENVPVIGYIGSFVQYEGLENLAQACTQLLKKGIDFRLLLVGNENASGSGRGPITAEIIRLAEEEGLAEKLIMPGRVPYEQVESYYSLIDIAPFPRKPQPVTEMVSPMKPLEALAMEKAVVVSSVRALTEMIQDNETGLIFEKGNIKDLADKLENLIKNPDLRYRLGKAGRIWVEKERTWKKTTAIAAEIIKQIAYKSTHG